jgi:hypothetical protein
VEAAARRVRSSSLRSVFSARAVLARSSADVLFDAPFDDPVFDAFADALFDAVADPSFDPAADRLFDPVADVASEPPEPVVDAVADPVADVASEPPEPVVDAVADPVVEGGGASARFSKKSSHTLSTDDGSRW